ncbi:MAG: GTPase HflX [Candidatus Heimdallarchaeota archaeon]|nr:GTPase HflX [Candidatus Heimdallarchaeota archaeon]
MKTVVVRWLKNKWQFVNNEIIELLETAGYNMIDLIEFKTENPHPKLFIPKMKLDQLVDLVAENNISKIIIDGRIRPHQIINLEELLGVEILDKPLLVLEIYERKANSKDIQLQIQLAQLKYNLPKTRLQIGAGVRSERPGFGGTGETVTELFLSDIQGRIRKLEHRLEKIKIKQLSAAEISDIPKIPIIGYYSSGKSTLFNILTDGSQSIGQEAFTTMILKSGRINFTGYPLDLIDSVGLVDLPRDILSAFDLMLRLTFVFPGIILCIDSSLSEEERQRQYSELERYFEIFTSKEDPKRVIVALTKTDLINDEVLFEVKNEISKLDFLGDYELLPISNQDPQNVKDKFIEAFEILFSEELITFNFSNLQPKFMNKLFNSSRIDEHGWNSDGTAFVHGTGIKAIVAPILGEIKNANG